MSSTPPGNSSPEALSSTPSLKRLAQSQICPRKTSSTISYRDPSIELNPSDVLYDRFEIKDVIGRGGFGMIYSAYDRRHKKAVAIKVDRKNEPKLNHPFTMLHLENYVMMSLHPPYCGREDLEGFPRTHFFGPVSPEESGKILVMELLGPSLHSLFSLCNFRFSYSTMLLIIDQLLERIEVLHKKGILHRDIKPENILIGRDNKKDILYLIDFGLSLVRKNPMDLNLTNELESESRYLGTCRYMSRRAHLKLRQTKKDDLEAMVYTISFFFRGGRLPWSGIKTDNEEEKHQKAYEMKSVISFEKIFRGAPFEFSLFAKKVRDLKFDEEPKYREYRRMFRSLGMILGVNYQDRKYDWSGFEGSIILHPPEVGTKDVKKMENATPPPNVG